MSKFRANQQSEPFKATSARNLAALLRALESDEEEPQICAECREHFAALYHKLDVEARDERALTALEQAAVRHLATCPDCAAEFDALRTALNALASDELPELARPHQFDLSFLNAPAPGTIPAPIEPAPAAPAPAESAPLWTDTVHDRVWQLIDAVQVRLQAGRAAFIAFPASLTPILTTGATLRAGQADTQAELLVLPAADATFSIHLAVGPLIADKAVVTVKLVTIENAQPLPNTLVVLRNSERQLLLGLMSGADGCAILESMAQGRYFVQVQYNQQTWEVPLMILAGSPLA